MFDFFGTLVLYKQGAFHTAPYLRTHDYLLRHGFNVSYEHFTTAFESASHELETKATLTGQEYHMNELGALFFRTAFSVDAPETLVVPFVAVFLEEWSRGVVYLDSLAPFLEKLAKTYRLSVLSNTNFPPLIHNHLVAMGVAHHFSVVFTSIEVGIRKPYPTIFQHALTELEVSAENIIYVGDSYVADYEGATMAGIRCILIAPQEQYPNVPHCVSSLFELEQYL